MSKPTGMTPEGPAAQRDLFHRIDLRLGSGQLCSRCDKVARGSATIRDKPYCHPSCGCHPDCYKQQLWDDEQERRGRT